MRSQGLSSACCHYDWRTKRHRLQYLILDADAVDHRAQHDLGTTNIASHVVNIPCYCDARVVRHVLNDLRRFAASDGQRGCGILPPDQRHDMLMEIERGSDIGVIAHLT